MFLENRELRIRIHNKKKDENKDEIPETTIEELTEDSANYIEDVGKELIKYFAIAAVTAYVVIKAVDTASKIAVKKTKSADNEE